MTKKKKIICVDENILAMGETSTNHQLNTGIEKDFRLMLKLADINAQLHNVLHLTLNTPIREKRIAGSPTSQGKCPTNKV